MEYKFLTGWCNNEVHLSPHAKQSVAAEVALNEEVNLHLQDGWELYGPPVMFIKGQFDVVGQAVTRTTDDT